MPVTIIATHIRSAEGVKIADYEYSDGTFERNTKLGVPDNADLNAVFAADIPAREAGRVSGEVNSNIGEIISKGPAAQIKTVASDASANETALREAYRGAERSEAVAIGAYLGTLTDAQLRRLFGVSQIELTTNLRPKFQEATSTWTKTRDAKGV